MINWKTPNLISKTNPLYNIILTSNILFATFLSVLATVTTFLADAAIQGELALQDSTTTWLTTLNLLGVNTIVPTASWFAERFGFKKMMTIGIFLLSFASLIAALANNFAILGLARFVEGIGTGFIFPIGLATLAKNLPPDKLPIAMILYICAAFGAGFAIGLPLAGFLTQFYSWRIIFALVATFSFFILISCIFIHEETEVNKKLKLDLFGFISFAIFIGSLLIALTYGPMLSTPEGWRDPFIVSCFSLALISIISTVIIESKNPDPILPLVLFKYPVFTVTCLAMILMGMSLFATIGSLTQYMLDALRYEKFITGKLGISYGLSMTLFSIVANILMKKIPIAVVTFIGFLILIFSYFYSNLLDWQTGPDQIIPIFFLRGMGLGLCLGPATIKALQAVPSELKSKAATILTFCRQVGGTYGGTVIAIISIKRTIFHTARFGEQATSESQAYQATFYKIYSHYQSSFSDPATDIAALTKARIIENIELQAYVQALNDAMIIFGYVTIVIAITLAYLNYKMDKKLKI